MMMQLCNTICNAQVNTEKQSNGRVVSSDISTDTPLSSSSTTVARSTLDDFIDSCQDITTLLSLLAAAPEAFALAPLAACGGT